MAIDFPDGSEVFVDANIFIYHFSGPTEYTDSCTQFLQRIEDGELIGLTSMLVVVETLHRLMIIEATSKLQIEPRVAIRHLKAHPSDVMKLTDHLTVADKIRALVEILPVDFVHVLTSSEIKKTYGLLTNDAINLAIMRVRHLGNIATNDPDFERIPDLVAWKPLRTVSTAKP